MTENNNQSLITINPTGSHNLLVSVLNKYAWLSGSSLGCFNKLLQIQIVDNSTISGNSFVPVNNENFGSDSWTNDINNISSGYVLEWIPDGFGSGEPFTYFNTENSGKLVKSISTDENDVVTMNNQNNEVGFKLDVVVENPDIYTNDKPIVSPSYSNSNPQELTLTGGGVRDLTVEVGVKNCQNQFGSSFILANYPSPPPKRLFIRYLDWNIQAKKEYTDGSFDYFDTGSIPSAIDFNTVNTALIRDYLNGIFKGAAIEFNNISVENYTFDESNSFDGTGTINSDLANLSIDFPDTDDFNQLGTEFFTIYNAILPGNFNSQNDFLIVITPYRLRIAPNLPATFSGLCPLFNGHYIFINPVSPISSDSDIEYIPEFLRTLAHEIGHAMDLRHPEDNILDPDTNDDTWLYYDPENLMIPDLIISKTALRKFQWDCINRTN